MPLPGTVAGSRVSFEGSAGYLCRYDGSVTGEAFDRIEGAVSCVGLPGTPQAQHGFDGSWTMTR